MLVSKVLEGGSLATKFADVKLAKLVASVINPVCKQYRLGQEIKGEDCRIAHKKTRLADPHPYRVDPEEDPFSYDTEILEIDVALESSAMVAKFNQIKPTLLNALQASGFSAVNLKASINVGNAAPEPFTQNVNLGPIPKDLQASDEAKALAGRLPEGPLKEAMLGLSKALKPKD